MYFHWFMFFPNLPIYIILNLISKFLNIVLSVWVMYCRYCVHEYHSFIPFTDETQFSKLKCFILVLEEQVAVGLYYILTGSCSFKTKTMSPACIYFNHLYRSGNNISILSSGVSDKNLARDI